METNITQTAGGQMLLDSSSPAIWAAHAVVISHRSSIEYLDLHRDVLPNFEVIDTAFEMGEAWSTDFDIDAKSPSHNQSYLSKLTDYGKPCPPIFPAGTQVTRQERTADVAVKDISRPVDVLVRDSGGMRSTWATVPHGMRSGIPAAHVWSIPGTNGCYVCRPELACALVGARMDLISRIEMALQLIGTYRRIRAARAPFYETVYGSDAMDYYPKGSNCNNCLRATVYGLKPLTNIDKLVSFVKSDSTNGVYGINHLRKILPYLCEGLASPAESEWYLRTNLDRKKMGGVGLPVPLVNQRLDLNREARSLTRHGFIIPDFYWPFGHIAVEINGSRDHGSLDGITEISRRDKAYRAMGIDCITLTPAELNDGAAFGSAVRAVERALGYVPSGGDTGFAARSRNLKLAIDNILPL